MKQKLNNPSSHKAAELENSAGAQKKLKIWKGVHTIVRKLIHLITKILVDVLILPFSCPFELVTLSWTPKHILKKKRQRRPESWNNWVSEILKDKKDGNFMQRSGTYSARKQENKKKSEGKGMIFLKKERAILWG